MITYQFNPENGMGDHSKVLQEIVAQVIGSPSIARYCIGLQYEVLNENGRFCSGVVGPGKALDPSFLKRLHSANRNDTVMKKFFENKSNVEKTLSWTPIAGIALSGCKLKRDKELISKAVNANGLCLAFADKRLQDDFDVVKSAVYQNGESLAFASSQLRDNKEIALIALRENWRAIKSLSSRLKNDLNLAAEAISIAASCFNHLSPSLRDDQDLLRIALSKRGDVIKSASERLRGNKEMCRMALDKSSRNYLFMTRKIRKKEEFYIPFFENKVSNDYLKNMANHEILFLDFKKLSETRKHFILKLMSNREKDLLLRAHFRKHLFA